MKTFKELTDSEKQELGGRLVQHEIMCNASAAVSALMQDSDEFIELRGSYDYEEAANYYIQNDMPLDHVTDYLIDADIQDYTLHDARSILYTHILDTDWHNDFCHEQGIDPDFDDVLEHWIVSDWLARKIEAYGGTVEHDFHGLTIWGRYTSGQAIALDHMIQRIAYDIYM